MFGSSVRQFGVRVARAVRRSVTLVDIYVVEYAEGGSHASDEMIDDLLIVRATEKQLPDLLDFDTEQRVKAVGSLWEDGQRVYLAYHQGRCVHRTLVRMGPGLEALHGRAVRRMIHHDMAWLHWGRTDDSARGLGIYPLVIRHIVADLPNRRIRGAIDATNKSSLRGIAKAGFLPISRIRGPFILGVLLWDDEVPYRPPESAQ